MDRRTKRRTTSGASLLAASRSFRVRLARGPGPVYAGGGYTPMCDEQRARHQVARWRWRRCCVLDNKYPERARSLATKNAPSDSSATTTRHTATMGLGWDLHWEHAVLHVQRSPTMHGTQARTPPTQSLSSSFPRRIDTGRLAQILDLATRKVWLDPIGFAPVGVQDVPFPP